MPLDTLYLAFDPARGVCPLPTTWAKPTACPTWTEDPRRAWSPPILALGPDAEAPAEARRPELRGGAIVLLAEGGSTASDARDHGFLPLDLSSLDSLWADFGCGAGRFRLSKAPPLPPAEAARVAGVALAGALERSPRVAVLGPAWALAPLAALPGVVVQSPTAGGGPTCPSRGLRWTGKTDPAGDRARPFLAAMSLAGDASQEDDEHPGKVGLEPLVSVRFAYNGPWVPARATREGWQVAALGGWLDVAHGNAHGWRWPCAADPWLAERLGAPEPIAAT